MIAQVFAFCIIISLTNRFRLLHVVRNASKGVIPLCYDPARGAPAL